jgi:putative transposase
MHDTLSTGKSIRTLNIIDDFNREALSITVYTSLTAARVVKELEKLLEWRGKREFIRSDNGPEFLAEVLQQWCSQSGIGWRKSTQNSLIEMFNITFRQDMDLQIKSAVLVKQLF